MASWCVLSGILSGFDLLLPNEQWNEYPCMHVRHLYICYGKMLWQRPFNALRKLVKVWLSSMYRKPHYVLTQISLNLRSCMCPADHSASTWQHNQINIEVILPLLRTSTHLVRYFSGPYLPMLSIKSLYNDTMYNDTIYNVLCMLDTCISAMAKCSFAHFN